MEKQVKKDHYNFIKYVNKDRFISYYYQLRYIYEIKPKKVLEIGAGNSFIKKIVLSDDLNYYLMDIDKDLKPDFVGSVTSIPKKNNSYDLVVCFQVLEHLPFNKFEFALKEMARITKKDAIISLPYCRIDFKCEFKIPLIKKIHVYITIPKFYKKYKYDGQHYWEVGAKGYALSRIKKIISKYFYIDEMLNPYENKYHIFFKLIKK